MPEQHFNEAEQFLLQNWTTTIEVENSIEQVREKYQALCDRIAENVKENHPELDIELAEVTVTSGANRRSGVIILGRSPWPSYGKNYPTGFWVKNLRLEVLNDSDQAAPTLGFWLHWSDERDDALYTNAEKAIREAAKTLVSKQPGRWRLGDNDETPLIGRDVASQQELIGMLCKDETKRFVETIVDQLEELMALIPAIDDAIEKTLGRE